MIDNKWFDKNGLIKPRLEWADSGNGIFYSALTMALARSVGENEIPQENELDLAIRACFKEPGLLMRTPDNKYGNTSHDDYLGLAVYRLNYTRRKYEEWFCQRIIDRHGVFGIYKNDPSNSLKVWFQAWIGRFIHVMAFIHAVGYGLNPISKFVLKTYLRFMKINPNDPSGVHLSWMFAYGCDLLGIPSDKLIELTLLLPKTTRLQFDEGHPIIEYADKAAHIFKEPEPALRAKAGGELLA